MLENIQIVIARAENPANLGQVARAMKNFGLSRLALVDCVPHLVQEAFTLGWNAKEILDNAMVFNSAVGAGSPRPIQKGAARLRGRHTSASAAHVFECGKAAKPRSRETAPLQQAVKNSVLVVGFTRRSGHSRGEPRSFTQILPQILEAAADHQISLLFGNEKNGLSNEELHLCHLAAVLPTSQEHASLNLSHAVAIAAFLIFNQTSAAELNLRKPERFYATQAELDDLMDDYKQVLEVLDYEDTATDDLLTRTLKNLTRLFKKSGLERREFHLFKAFLSRVATLLRGTGPRARPEIEQDRNTGQPQGLAPTP